MGRHAEILFGLNYLVKGFFFHFAAHERGQVGVTTALPEPPFDHFSLRSPRCPHTCSFQGAVFFDGSGRPKNAGKEELDVKKKKEDGGADISGQKMPDPTFSKSLEKRQDAEEGIFLRLGDFFFSLVRWVGGPVE